MQSLRFVALSLLLAFVVVTAGPIGPAEAAGSPIVITPISPDPGSLVRTTTPNISASFTDSAGIVTPNSVVVLVDGVNVTGFDSFTVSARGFSYLVPTILKLAPGNHTVQVNVSDSSGNSAQYSWGFVVNTTAPPNNPFANIHPNALVSDVIIGSAIVAAAFGLYILYLRRTRKFTFRKYFATHPVKKQYLVVYAPAIAAFLFILLGLDYVFNDPAAPRLAVEYVLIGGVFIGLTAFAVDARSERRKMRAYERAFAQFLFEMADAMRGGIDPAKAVVELAKTHTNILRRHLRIAADGVRMGRSFDEVLSNMVAPMKSALISRYAGLIADAAGVGGETSVVVYRAAKDMDDFIKIEIERDKQLVMPVAVLYIAFGVLMAVLFALLNIAPSIGSINISVFSSATPLSATGASTVPRLDPTTLRERFFDLMVINSIGTGAIIGAFTEGKVRYGLLHSLALVAATTIAFAVLFPG